jgi:hypothetical protein
LKYLFIISVLLFSCKKEESKYTYATFYMGKSISRNNLYVDGIYKGVLTHISAVPACGEKMPDRTIVVLLKEGKHNYYMSRDSVSSSVIKIDVSGHCNLISVR